MWLKNPEKWQLMQLSEQLELLRKHYCTGTAGSSHSVGCTRSATDKALKAAIQCARFKDKYENIVNAYHNNRKN
jgi:hypothetical protein